MVDRFDTINTTSNEAIQRSLLALDTANTALDNSNTAMADAADAVTTTDVASVAAASAVSTANTAVVVASGIDAKAQTALDNSVAALNTANNSAGVSKYVAINGDPAGNDVPVAMGEYAVAVGSAAEAAEWGVAVGRRAVASGENTIAIGEDAEASGDSSVAIGKDSEATETYNFAVGNTMSKRRIVNVADGVSSTDAATMGQLTQMEGQAVAASALKVHTHTSDQIVDSAALGRHVLASADPAYTRALIGAGTSNLTLGYSAGTAKPGDWAPHIDMGTHGYLNWGRVVGVPAYIASYQRRCHRVATCLHRLRRAAERLLRTL